MGSGKPLMKFLADRCGVHRLPSTLLYVAGLKKSKLGFEVDYIAAVKG